MVGLAEVGVDWLGQLCGFGVRGAGDGEGFGADGVGFEGADAVGDDGVGEEVLWDFC